MNKQMTHAYAAAVIEWRGNKLQTNQEIGGRHLMANCAALTKAGEVRSLGAGGNQGRNLMTLSVPMREV
jgi:hypothetical protein